MSIVETVCSDPVNFTEFSQDVPVAIILKKSYTNPSLTMLKELNMINWKVCSLDGPQQYVTRGLLSAPQEWDSLFQELRGCRPASEYHENTAII